MGRPDISRAMLSGTHILLVDDDPTRRQLLKLVLERGGALVTEAESPDAAWQSVERITPDLMAWSLALGIGGAAGAVLQRIWAADSPRTRAIPIVALAVDATSVSMDEALEAGFAGYVRAPFEAGHLAALLAEVVETSRRGD